MLKKIILTLSFLLMVFSSLVAQDKIGTTGAQFLEISPSVKANGMGQVGTAVVSNDSYYFNPSNLGLLVTRNNLSISSYPTWSRLFADVEVFNLSLSLPILHKKSTNSDFYIGGAYYYFKLRSGDQYERTYGRGTADTTGGVFSWRDESHNFVISFARTGTIDIAIGGTIKSIKQTSPDYSTDNFAFDVGGIVRYNIKNCTNNTVCSFVIPAVGLSMKNFGPDMTFLNNSYPLPKSTSFGFSVTTGKTKLFSGNKSADVYKLAPAVDVEKRKYDSWVYRFGVEVSLYEIINFRVGRISYDKSSENELTYGFSLSTFRIGKFKMLTSESNNSNAGGVMGFLYNKLNVEYNFASYDRYFTADAQKYHEIVLNYSFR